MASIDSLLGNLSSFDFAGGLEGQDFNTTNLDSSLLIAQSGAGVEQLLQQVPQSVSQQGNTLRIIYENGQSITYTINSAGNGAATFGSQSLNAAQTTQVLRSASGARNFATSLSRLGRVARNSIILTIASELIFPQGLATNEFNFTVEQVNEKLRVLQTIQQADSTGSLEFIETGRSSGQDRETIRTLRNRHTGVVIGQVDRIGGLWLNPNLQSDLTFTPWTDAIPLNENTANGAPGSIYIPPQPVYEPPPLPRTVVQPEAPVSPSYDPTNDFRIIDAALDAARTGGNGGYTLDQVQAAADRALAGGAVTLEYAQMVVDFRGAMDLTATVSQLRDHFGANTLPDGGEFAFRFADAQALLDQYTYLAETYVDTDWGDYFSSKLAEVTSLTQVSNARAIVSGFLQAPGDFTYEAVNDALYVLGRRDPAVGTNAEFSGLLDDVQERNRNRDGATDEWDPTSDPWDEPVEAPETPEETPEPQPEPDPYQPRLPPATNPNQPALPPAGPDPWDQPAAPGLPGGEQTNDDVDIDGDPWDDQTPDVDSGDGAGDGPPNLPPTGGNGPANNDDGDENTPDQPEPNQNWRQRLENFWQSTQGSFRQRSAQFQEIVGQTLKTVGTAYAATNVAGGTGGAIFYTGLRESRTGTRIDADNAVNELAMLQADPDTYITDNYTNRVNMPGAGFAIGDTLYNISGHLLEVTNADGSVYHFRRVPEDMYNALLDNQASQAVTTGSVFVPEMVTLESGEEAAVWVEIRPPARAEGLRNVDVSLNPDENRTNGGFGIRPEIRIGPEEGQTASLRGTLSVGRMLDGPNSTRFRWGAPSPTNPRSTVGIRQQETRATFKVGVGAGALDFNNSRVRDLTNPDSPLSGANFRVFDGSAYLVAGDRSRVRIDSAAPLGEGLDSTYGRVRTTGFIELGLGADFARYVWGDGQYVSANGYLEAQSYPFDARGQARSSGLSGSVQRVPGFMDAEGLFEIDPALQITTNAEWIPNVLFQDRLAGLTNDLSILTPSRWGQDNPLAGNVDLVGRLQAGALSGDAQTEANTIIAGIDEGTPIKLADGTTAEFRTDGTRSFVSVPATGEVFDVTGSNALSATSMAYIANPGGGAQLLSIRVPVFYGMEQLDSPSYGQGTTSPLSTSDAPSVDDLRARGATEYTQRLADGSEVDVFEVWDESRGTVAYVKLRYGNLDVTYEVDLDTIDALDEQLVTPFTSPNGNLTPTLISAADLEGSGAVTPHQILSDENAQRLTLPEGGRVYFSEINGTDWALYFAPNGAVTLFDTSIYDVETLKDYFWLQGANPGNAPGIVVASAPVAETGLTSDLGPLLTWPDLSDARQVTEVPETTTQTPPTLEGLKDTIEIGQNDLETRGTAPLPELQDGVLSTLDESGTDIAALNARLNTNLSNPAQRNWLSGFEAANVTDIDPQQEGQYNPADVTGYLPNPDGSRTLVLDENTSVARDGTVIIRNDAGEMIESVAPSGERTAFNNMRPVESEPTDSDTLSSLLASLPSIQQSGPPSAQPAFEALEQFSTPTTPSGGDIPSPPLDVPSVPEIMPAEENSSSIASGLQALRLDRLDR